MAQSKAQGAKEVVFSLLINHRCILGVTGIKPECRVPFPLKVRCACTYGAVLFKRPIRQIGEDEWFSAQEMDVCGPGPG